MLLIVKGVSTVLIERIVFQGCMKGKILQGDVLGSGYHVRKVERLERISVRKVVILSSKREVHDRNRKNKIVIISLKSSFVFGWVRYYTI